MKSLYVLILFLTLAYRLTAQCNYIFYAKKSEDPYVEDVNDSWYDTSNGAEIFICWTRDSFGILRSELGYKSACGTTPFIFKSPSLTRFRNYRPNNLNFDLYKNGIFDKKNNIAYLASEFYDTLQPDLFFHSIHQYDLKGNLLNTLIDSTNQGHLTDINLQLQDNNNILLYSNSNSMLLKSIYNFGPEKNVYKDTVFINHSGLNIRTAVNYKQSDYFIANTLDDQRYKLIKRNAEKKIDWNYSFDDAGSKLFGIAFDGQFVIVSGCTKKNNKFYPCVYRYDTSGTAIDTFLYDNPTTGLPATYFSIEKTNDGGYILSGHKTTSIRENKKPIFLLKLNSNFNKIFEISFDLSTFIDIGVKYTFFGTYAKESEDGGYYIFSKYGNLNVFSIIIKTNSKGEVTSITYPEDNMLQTKILAQNFDHNQLRLQAEVQRGTILGIFDMSGRWIKNEISNDQTIDISDLPAGMYLIRQINSKQKSGSAEKFVKY
ncbi:MAG: T9SS type A sorting domain-containing protein [Saprospiraceae bacterium]|jgi:hypothetical protein|nr:T9SS type A sorting domain-containing protein [Saprospiraceae bacterium]MBK7796800.1 T9SS type A sorting domain-containing protein [Saprospiraceae bacterium]